MESGFKYGFGIVVLAVTVGLLYYGQGFFVPVVAALLLTFLLDRPMRLLNRLGLPNLLAAFLLVIGLTLTAAAVVFAATQSVTEWLDRAPEVAESIERTTGPLRDSVEGLSEMVAEVEQMADPMPRDKEPQTVVIQGETVQQKVLEWFTEALVTMVLTLLLLFFCLATGGQFMRRLIRLPRERRNQVRIVRVVKAMQEQLSRYLFTITCMNALLGVAAAGALWAYGVEEFWVLGLLGGLTNFIPYFGSIVTVAAITYVSSFTAESLLLLVLPGLTFMLLNGIEAFGITPALLGMRLQLNPVFILLSILLWGALWGIGGMFLAVPILATIKVVLDNWDDDTHRFGALLG